MRLNFFRSFLFFFENRTDKLSSTLFSAHSLELSASLETIIDESFFLFWFTDFSLFINEKSISIFEGVLSSTLKRVHNLRPFLLPIVSPYQTQQLDIFFYLPRPFFNLRIQITIPMFSALFGTSKYFSILMIDLILFLSHCFPIDLIQMHIRPRKLFFNNSSKKRRLVIVPMLNWKVNFFDT